MRFVLAVLAGLLLAGGAAADAGSIGSITSASGDARILRAGQEVKAEAGAPLREKDVLRTGADGALGVTFRDNSTVSLGPSSELDIETYVFEPAQRKYGFLGRMTRGTALFVSGALAKRAPENVAVATPTSTIGVRGTRFLVAVDQGG